MVASPTDDPWANFWESVLDLEAQLKGIRAVNVNSAAVREEARQLVQGYFRSLRPQLESIALAPEYVSQLDAAAQRLLDLSNGRNRKDSYLCVVRDLKKMRSAVESEREIRLGRLTSTHGLSALQTGLEEAIWNTLLSIVPTAALSYQQAVQDLHSPDRVSFRGTAMELREALRELLDHLAPDADVIKSEGFKLEKEQTGPTMKQKVVFILRSRGKSKSMLDTPRDAAALVDLSTANLARSVYSRGSLDGHISATRTEVLQLKLYVDGILADLLEIHS